MSTVIDQLMMTWRLGRRNVTNGFLDGAIQQRGYQPRALLKFKTKG